MLLYLLLLLNVRVLLNLHGQGSVMRVLLLLLLHLLMLLHTVHVVHYHLLRCDLLGVHRLLRRVLNLLQVDFLVLHGSSVRLGLRNVLVHAWCLALRDSTDSNGRFSAPLGHLRLSGALHGQTLRVPA